MQRRATAQRETPPGARPDLLGAVTGTVTSAINTVISLVNGMIRAIDAVQIRVPVNPTSPLPSTSDPGVPGTSHRRATRGAGESRRRSNCARYGA